MGSWVSPSMRDEIVDYMQRYIGLTELPLTRFFGWLGVGRSKYYVGYRNHPRAGA